MGNLGINFDQLIFRALELDCSPGATQPVAARAEEERATRERIDINEGIADSRKRILKFVGD